MSDDDPSVWHIRTRLDDHVDDFEVSHGPAGATIAIFERAWYSAAYQWPDSLSQIIAVLRAAGWIIYEAPDDLPTGTRWTVFTY